MDDHSCRLAVATACLSALAVWVPAGCANYTRPVAPPAAVTAAERNFEAVWQGSLNVLRRYNFTLDRRDRRAGVITTRALLARHWFEFWRPDAANAFDFFEGAFQTVYRTAKVTIRPASESSDAFVPSVEVAVSRSTTEKLGIVAAGEAYNRFFESRQEQGLVRQRRRRQRAKRQRREARKHGAATGEETAGDTELIALADGRLVSVGEGRDLAAKLCAEIKRVAQKRLAANMPDRP